MRSCVVLCALSGILFSCGARHNSSATAGPLAAPVSTPGPQLATASIDTATVDRSQLFLRRPTHDRWTWPAPEQFDAWYDQTPDARTRPVATVRVLFARDEELTAAQGRALDQDPSAADAWDLLLPAAGQVIEPTEYGERTVELPPMELVALVDRSEAPLSVLFAEGDDWFARQLLAHDDGSPRSYTLDPSGDAVAVFEDGVLVVDTLHRSPALQPTPDAWQARSYTSTLLGFEAPVYPAGVDWDAEPDPAAVSALDAVTAAGDAASREQLQALIDSQLPAHDWGWDTAISAARAGGHDDLALELYARYRPMGRCSMDTHPQSVARDYAQLCHSSGRLGCFLQLQVRIMGQRFSRVAYSSYGDASHASEVGALDEVGVDTRAFLLGLVFDFREVQERPIDIDLWRLGRAIAEWEGGPQLLDELEVIAQDPDVDELNRLRAAITWTYAMQQDGEDGEMLRNLVEGWDLAPSQLAWLEWSS